MSAGTLLQPALLSAEAFAERPDPGYPEELVRGEIVPGTFSKPRQGQICTEVVFLLGRHLDEHDLGRVVINTGVITERGPDTVRGADVAFYGDERVPKGPLPNSYLAVPPDLVFEVRRPSDRWPAVIAKVGEYLEAGVSVVVVLDDERRSAQVFDANGETRVLGAQDKLTFGNLLPGFSVATGRSFD